MKRKNGNGPKKNRMKKKQSFGPEKRRLLLRGAAAAAAGLLCGLLLARLYCLKLPQTVVIALLFLPSAAVWLKKKEERRSSRARFHGLITYMEQMIYLFRRRPKLAAALREAEETVPEELQPVLASMRGTLESGENGNAYAEAFGKLEALFPCRALKQLHHYFQMIEELGGEYAGGLDLLLAQTRGFSESEEAYQKELDRIRGKVTLSVGLSLLIGCVSVRLIPADFSITDSPVYLWLTTGALTAFLAVFLAAQYLFTRTWGQEEKPLTEERVRLYRERLRGMSTKEKKKAAAELLLCGGLTVFCFMKEYTAAGYAAVFLCIWEVLRPLRRKRQARKALRKEALARFPEWLRELSVHLQTQTVQTALSDSLADSAPILRSYLQEMLRAVDEDPIHIGPYRSFMKELELQEVCDAMVLLYSLNGAGRRNAEEQMNALVRQNTELWQRQEAVRREDAASFLGLTVAIPMGVTVVKLLADMALTLLAFLSAH